MKLRYRYVVLITLVAVVANQKVLASATASVHTGAAAGEIHYFIYKKKSPEWQLFGQTVRDQRIWYRYLSVWQQVVSNNRLGFDFHKLIFYL